MNGRRLAVILAAIGLGAGGVAAGLATSAGGASPSQASASSAQSHSYYQSMMGQFGSNSMMGGSNGSLTGATSYGSMMGGASAPGWMSGGTLPSYMMGTSTDPGKVMGKLFANAPGPRVNPAEATRLGHDAPVGATVDVAHNSVTFSGSSAHIVALASPSGGTDETFRIAGLVDPTIAVKTGTRVTIEVINADKDTSHGMVVTATRSNSSWMPMMTANPAFGGSAVWFLGDPTSAGMHASTISFTASAHGTYKYLCPVPGHAQEGMVGTFRVLT
jgi:rusticyanin